MIVPFFSHCIPSMLKCIWIGLVALLVQSIMTSVVSYFMTKDIQNALIFDDMRLTFTNNITFQNGLQSDIFTLLFYIMALPQCALKSTIVLFSIISYAIAAYKHKYRQCNELSDVNERLIIAEYTERELLQEYSTNDAFY